MTNDKTPHSDDDLDGEKKDTQPLEPTELVDSSAVETPSSEAEEGSVNAQKDTALDNKAQSKSVDPQPLVEQRAEAPKTKTSEMHKPKSKTTPVTKSWRRGVFLWFVVVVLLLVLIGGAGFGLFQGKQLIEQQSIEIEALRGSQKQNQQLISESFAQSQKALAKKYEQQVAQVKTRLAAAEQRLSAQNKRLLSMSTTSREDWLLAEAEYLLKLANQRVLVERSADSAKGLLVEADTILRDLDDPDLFTLRKAIAGDLAELRLVANVDAEGIFLRLSALSDNISSLSHRPQDNRKNENDESVKRDQNGMVSDDISDSSNVPVGEANEASPWYYRSLESFQAFSETFKGFYKINTYTEKPQPLMPPEASLYLQQNLRFMLERAQLGVLREQQSIYDQSVLDALSLLETYYPRSELANSMAQQLEQLRSVVVVQVLPDITQSLELLRTYIDTLHRLQGSNMTPLKKTAVKQVNKK